MKEIKVTINGKTYSVKVASSEGDREKGLQNVENLPQDEGMLFEFSEEDNPVIM